MNHQYTASSKDKKLGDDWQKDHTASGTSVAPLFDFFGHFLPSNSKDLIVVLMGSSGKPHFFQEWNSNRQKHVFVVFWFYRKNNPFFKGL